MSDRDRDQNEPVPESTEPGFLHIEEQSEETASNTPSPSALDTNVKPATPLPPQSSERAGTVEHLAARRPVPELDTDTPEIKQRLVTLRAEWTRLVTGLRWEGEAVEEIADRMIPLLNVGSIEQWKATLLPFLYEIDRGGALIPAWLHIIERGDSLDLPVDANPAETVLGRARRFGILMLGNYKMMGIAGLGNSSRLARPRRDGSSRGERDLTEVLGDLATDPNTSLYATQALVKHSTVPAIQELIRALRYAKGWAKVDVVLGCLELKQEQFNDLLIASGLEDVPGLESYLATPLYRSIPLETYLAGDEKMNIRLIQQAALIFSQVVQDSMTPPTALTEASTLPVVFERHLPTMMKALFAGAQREPLWQNIVALHRLGLLLGRYWSEISQGKLRDGRIVEPVYHCLPLMNDVEYWMQGRGRDVLLRTLAEAPEEGLTPVVKVLGDMRDPRTSTPLMARLDAISALKDRQHALMIGTMCETLGQFGDRRAVGTLQQLVERTVNVPARVGRQRRRDNLPISDPDVPASIVYAAAVRTCGQLADKAALEFIYPAASDFDPYVRSQALEAIKRIDPRGEDARSHNVAREALQDPRESVVRSAILLIVQYRDQDGIALLRQFSEIRPDLSYLAQDALRQLGQYTGA